MSTADGIGARMAAIRGKYGFSQARAAATLEIADKSYKNYETESRELPLSVALRFCDRFEVDLPWLIYGKTGTASDPVVGLVGKTLEAVLLEAQHRKRTLTPTKAARIGKFVFLNCVQKGTEPGDEIGAVFDLMDEE